MNHKAPFFLFLFFALLFLAPNPTGGIAAPLLNTSKKLPLLRDSIIQGNEVEHMVLGLGVDVTSEMSDSCGVDCVKWFWGGANNITIMMSQTGSEEEAKRVSQNLLKQYQSLGASFYEYQEDNCEECSDTILSWQVKREKYSGDIVYLSTHGSVWILVVLHQVADQEELLRDYCQGEMCWETDLIGAHSYYLDIIKQQHRKLALKGYPPIMSGLKPIVTITPRPAVPALAPVAVKYLDLFASPHGSQPFCDSLCLNGLEPGKSNADAIPGFYKRLGMEHKELVSPSGNICINLSSLPDGNYFVWSPEVCLKWKDGLIETIELWSWNHPEQFYIRRIAAVLGVPEKITSALKHGMGVGGTPTYVIALHYPKKFLIVEIQGYIENYQTRNICLGDRTKQTANLIYYSKGSESEILKNFNEGYYDRYDWAEANKVSTLDLFTRMQDVGRCIPQ